MYRIKFVLLFFMVFLIQENGYGQDCSEIKEKNEKLEAEILEKDSQIKESNGEIEYFREALNLLTSGTKSESQDILFKINSIEGNRDQGSIVIQGLIENTGLVGRFQMKRIIIIDPQGNEYTTSNMNLGSERIAISNFQKDIPLKMSFKFESVKEEFPVVKALIVEFYNRNGFSDKNPSVIFKNLDISWK